MMRVLLFQLLWALLVQTKEVDAFVSPSTTPRRAFVTTPQHRYMTPTRSQDDWDLPDELPDNAEQQQSFSSHSTFNDACFPRKRRLRLQQEALLQQKYVTGDDLIHLRQHALSLREELQQARLLQATRRIQELEQQILKIHTVDAEFVYTISLERMYMAEAEGRTDDYERYHAQAMEARSALPQFQLDGLWVGKYGDDCYEMINVTYVGDTLIAHKVTGHSTVPSGQVSFQTDLSPFASSETLDPIELGDAAAEQWDCKYLPRFSGQGQVASSGFRDAQFMDGQLILVNDYFSFAWIPLGHQVFFGRPSAELTLKMLQDTTLQERAFLDRCMEETVLLQEEAQEDDQVYYSTNQGDYYNQEGCFE